MCTLLDCSHFDEDFFCKQISGNTQVFYLFLNGKTDIAFRSIGTLKLFSICQISNSPDLFL